MNRHSDMLVFSGELPPRFDEAIEQIGPLLDLAVGNEGMTVEVFRAQGVVVEKRGNRAWLGTRRSIHAKRSPALRPG